MPLVNFVGNLGYGQSASRRCLLCGARSPSGISRRLSSIPLVYHAHHQAANILNMLRAVAAAERVFEPSMR